MTKVQVWFPRAPEGDFALALAREWPRSLARVEGEGAGGAAQVLVSGVPTAEQLDRAPALRSVVIPYAGVPARTRELLLTRPELRVYNLHHNAAPTAEHALALLLAAAKRLLPVDQRFRSGDWRERWEGHGAVLLEGRRALVLGPGAIGTRCARVLDAFGVETRTLGRRQLPPPQGRAELRAALHELLPAAEILIVALPLTPDTERILQASEFERLPHGALFVNVARGAICDEAALYAALRSGRIAAAGLDVWWRYPQGEDERAQLAPAELPFAALDQVVLTPHLAGHCDRTEELRASALVRLLRALAEDEEPPGRVHLERGY